MDHQKASKIKKKCKFVTVILFGTMSQSFRKIVQIVSELRALSVGVGLAGMWYLTSIFFPVLIYHYPFIKMKKSQVQYFFSVMDIKIFTTVVVRWGAVGREMFF